MFGIEKRKQKKEEERRRIEEERRKIEEDERRKEAEKKASMKELGAYIMIIICDMLKYQQPNDTTKNNRFNFF